MLTAQSTGRPRSSAMAVMDAMVSFMTLSPSVPSMSAPWPPTGVAAPMLVAGAIAATWPASVMKVPALAARLPAGATHTITGIGASSSAWTMSRVASSEPPGVSSSMTTAGAPSAAARRCRREIAGHDLVHDARGGQHDDGARLGSTREWRHDEQHQAEQAHVRLSSRRRAAIERRPGSCGRPAVR